MNAEGKRKKADTEVEADIGSLIDYILQVGWNTTPFI